jgi:hypothetical protein
MLNPGIVITKIAEDAVYGPDLTRQAFIRVEFMVDKHGPFVERFPKDQFTGATRDQKLNDFAMHVR